MATVNVIVNGRPYSVGCEDGQEEHVEMLAQTFDQQVRDVGQQVGQVGDLRLFLMAALVTADELADTRHRLAQAHAQGPSSPKPQTDRRAVQAIEEAARRIEALNATLD